MPRVVGAKAIKVTCLQVLPGHEFDVGRVFLERFRRLTPPERAGLSSDLIIFKGFGIWDLIMFSESANYEATLTKLGPISGITSSIQYLCFPYMIDSHNEMAFTAISQKTFLGISLIKMKRALCHHDLTRLEAGLREDGVEPIILGSIGFNEVLLLTPSDGVEPIVEGLSRLNTSSTDHAVKGFSKSKTQIAIRHDLIMPEADYPSDAIKLAGMLAARDPKLADPIGEKLIVGITITTKPDGDLACSEYWSQQDDYELSTLYGDQDIHVRLKDGSSQASHWNPFRLMAASRTSWAKVLADVLLFRKFYHTQIQSTCTTFSRSLVKEDYAKCKTEDPTQQVLSIEFDENLCHSFLGVMDEQQALCFVRQIYALQGYARQPALRRIYASMIDALPRYCKTILEGAPEGYAAMVSRLLGKGLDLRAYGTEPVSPKLNASYYRLAGGLQQAIAALELFPLNAFRRINTKFRGFIVADEPVYGHYFGALLVPLEDFWHPERWWALHHEVAHAIDAQARVFDKRSPVFKTFCDKMHSHLVRDNVDYMREVTAEIIGFSIGFFHDLEAFNYLLWNYLFSIAPLREQIDQKGNIIYHLQRCYAVHLFHRLSRQESGNPIDETYFMDRDLVVKDYTNYIISVQTLAAKAATSAGPILETCRNLRPELLAAQHWPILSALGPMLAELNNRIENLTEKYNSQFWAQRQWLEDLTTQEAVGDILNGKIYQGEMLFPEAVIFLLITGHVDRALTFTQRIAAVLSFSHASMRLQVGNESITN